MQMRFRGRGSGSVKVNSAHDANFGEAPNWAKGSGLVRDNVADGVADSDFFGTKLPTTEAQRQGTDRACVVNAEPVRIMAV